MATAESRENDDRNAKKVVISCQTARVSAHDGFRFGQRRRLLPTCIELAVLSFLDLQDLSVAILLCRVLASRVADALRLAKSVEVQPFDSSLALHAAARHCRSLTRFVDDFHASVPLVLKILQNNKSTLRFFRARCQNNPTVFTALLECPSLEQLFVSLSVAEESIPLLTLEKLPNLRDLRLPALAEYYQHSILCHGVSVLGLHF